MGSSIEDFCSAWASARSASASSVPSSARRPHPVAGALAAELGLDLDDARVEREGGKILQLLQDNGGFLPYHDKSVPEAIYDFFGMSKKTFKMTTGALYRQKKIEFTQTGIRLVTEE